MADNVRVLATHGLEFDGVIQNTCSGGPNALALRMDCPKGGPMICTTTGAERCQFFLRYVSNRERGTYIVVCGCSK